MLSTPFDADGEIDARAFAAEIDWVFGSGADGITLAMVSEILRMDGDERRRLAEIAVDAAADRGAVIVSVGAESTHQAVRLATHAQHVQASAVMANPPLTTTPDADALVAHFTAIADASADLPMIVQDASGYVGTPIPIDVFTTLLDRYGAQKVQFKPEADPLGPRLTMLMDRSDGRARVFEGSGGRALVESHRRGVVGTMPGPDLVPSLCALWSALERGEDELAYTIQSALVPLLNLVSSLDSYVAIEKRLLVVQGVIPSARQRGPVSFTIDAHTAAELDVLFARLRAVTPQPPAS